MPSRRSLTLRALHPLLVAFAVWACASCGGAQNAGAIDVSSLPSSHFLTDGNQPLYLTVTISDGQVTGVAQTDAASANVVVTFKQRDGSRTMVEIASNLTVALKWDLYVSSDNQHYVHTSSCPRPPVANEFATWEQWPRSVASLAISNFRVPADGKLACS